MEQDCIAGLYRSLGLSVGAEFSSDDVSLLYRKVFHVSSDTDEAHAAMKKIAGGDQSWSCVGENVLEVLLEMEKEREKKEKLYWDLQLLNVGNLGIFCATDKPAMVHPDGLACLRQNRKAHHQSDSQPFQSCTYVLQRERPVGKKEPEVSVRTVRRLKKAARQCWSRLASEGVQSVLLPSPGQSQSLEVKGQAWGCVTLSEVLLLVEVKYDVVAHLLYTEMLQEHYTPGIWENLLPWQQQKEEEGLEDLAEEALESGDMLGLAELPGAFRMYRGFVEVSAESREQSWSAVSLLCDLNMFRQQEKETVTVLGKRLDRDNLTLLCLNIRLATVRAQREKTSHAALLAARQRWETWPHVKSPCKAEQAALWLHGDEEEHERGFISPSPQQAVLQLLVLTQEQERKHLLKLVHGLSPEDLQEPGCRAPPREEGRTQAAHRDGCIRRLRQIRVDLQKQDETKINFEQINPEPQHQPRINSESTTWSQRQLEACSVLLLTHLMELHEVRASATLPALMDKSEQRIKTLRDDYESELQAQRCTSAIQLLISGASLAPGVAPYPNFAENSSNGPVAAQAGGGGGWPVNAQTGSGGPAEAQAIDSTRGPGVDLNVVQATVGTNRQDVCAGCGVAMEDLPYLEILCAPDVTNDTRQGLAAEGGAEEDQEGKSPTKSPQSYEKQASLITLAWSKPPDDDDDDREAEAAGQGQDTEDGLKTRVQPSDIGSAADETSGESDREELRPPDFPESAEQQRSTLKPEERATAADYPDKGEAVSEYDPLTEGATPQAAREHLLVDLPEIKRHAGDLRSGLTDEGGAEVETWPATAESAPWDPRGPEPARSEDREYNSQARVECSPAERESTLMERERVTEPVSAMERERTMRNLVDMQRKVEQRQQRDRERQLLRVQERLSIVQNRKAEEDLLGLKLTDRLRHLTQDLPQEDKNQQKTVVRERLERLRRERSNVMQSKRDRNTAVFKELLGPVALSSRDTDEGDN